MKKRICLNGLENEKVMSPSELKALKGGSILCCDFYGCFSVTYCEDCIGWDIGPPGGERYCRYGG